MPHVDGDEELVGLAARRALIDHSVREDSSEPPGGESHLPRRDDIDFCARGEPLHQRGEGIGGEVCVGIRVPVADDGDTAKALCLDEGEPLPRGRQLAPRICSLLKTATLPRPLRRPEPCRLSSNRLSSPESPSGSP